MGVEARRDFILKTLATGLYAATYSVTGKAATANGIPGPFPGRVVAVERPGAVVQRKYQREAVRAMLNKGMMELTGAPSPQEAWRHLFQPGDVVGLKLNPVGRPFVMSAPEVVVEIVDGLKMAGVAAKDVVAYDRYRREFLQAGFDKWLPEGVRWTYASEEYAAHPFQLDMDGYDSSQYVEMPLVFPGADPADPHSRRSYLSNFISKDVNKLLNLSVLKHHQSAGVTIALKNLSHGLVNNVSRSHSSKTLNTCGTFIPNIVDHPVIRQKVVLNICDGILGAYHGGPGGKVEKYVWDHNTMYFATDPVALDKVGWKAIDAKRVEKGMLPIAPAKPDKDSTFLNMQVEHIEIAGALGLGAFDDKKIDVRRFKLA
jgi:uncharacterized protein (DUF362 family)